MTLCERAASAQRRMLDERPTARSRTVYAGMGEGGDRSLEIDRRAEDAVFAGLERLHADGYEFTVVSEERGVVRMSGDERHVIVDPIDGSLNARRLLPGHCLSVAVADGPTMADVSFAYVHDFGSGQTYAASRGDGAWCDGEALSADDPGRDLEVVGVESAEPSWMVPLVEGLDGHAYRVRVVGSAALTLALVGAARLDGMLTARPVRSFDVAAAQLIAREGGARVGFAGQPLDEAGLGIDARYRVIAARTDESFRTLSEVQRAATRSS